MNPIQEIIERMDKRFDERAALFETIEEQINLLDTHLAGHLGNTP